MDRSGTVAFFGGGPFQANDELDSRLLGEVGADRAVVLPTADAFEQPAELVAAASSWADRLGVVAEGLMVLQRHDADEADAASIVAGAQAVYLVGDSPMHLRSALKDTAVFAALQHVLGRGGLVAGVGAAGAALCDPMFDLRGGAFTLGLGLVTGLAVIPASETWSRDLLARTHALADGPLVELPTGAAAIRRPGGWDLVGGAVVAGELP